MRVLPRLNEAVNEEWISDKTRFACDGLKRQRLDRPYVRRDGKLQPASWDEAFAAIAERSRAWPAHRIAAIAGDHADVEAMFALKELMGALGSPNLDCRQDGATIDPRQRAGYLFNTTIAGIDQADAILIVGSNPRQEAPIINARIRKRFLQGGVKIGVIGPKLDLTYQVRASRRRAADPGRDRRWPAQVRRGAEGGEEPDADPRRGRAAAARRRGDT